MIKIQAFTFNPFQQNTYIVWNDENDAFLIDPGCYNLQEQNMLHEFIKDEKLLVKKMLLTHCHIDHIFGTQWAHELFNLNVHIHPLEEKILETASMASQMYGVIYHPYGGEKIFLNEGDDLKLGDEKFSVFHTPGHSPGSICFYNKDNNVLISGDVLFKESIGRTDLPLGNYDDLINAIEEKIYVLPDNTQVFPGHGPATTVGYEKKHNPFVRSVV